MREKPGNRVPGTRSGVVSSQGIQAQAEDDRMLVVQAITEPLHLLTSEEKLQPYSDLVVLV
jgi:hypothetical protein